MMKQKCLLELIKKKAINELLLLIIIPFNLPILLLKRDEE